MADDPYANTDPYAQPTAYNPSPVTDTVRALGDADPQSVGALLKERRQAFQDREAQRQKVETTQQLNVDEMSKLLDETAATIKKSRQGRSNLPLMAMGAAMMSSPGNFGTQLGAGFGAMVPAIQKQREEEDQTALELAKLGLKKGELVNMPLDAKLKYLQAMQTGDMSTIRALEVANIRAQATAGKQGKALQEFEEWKKSPGRAEASYEDYVQWKADTTRKKASELQQYDEWAKSPGNSGKSYEDFMKQKSDLQQRKAAEIQEYELARQQDPNLTLDQFRVNKASNVAKGHETGKEQAQAAQKIPEAIATLTNLTQMVDELKTHPGLDKSVGRNALFPTVPGSHSADFNVKLKQLAGQQFLQAFGSLRGGGAITEIEGQKATEALGNLDVHQSKEQFLRSLDQVLEIANRSIAVAKQRAGQPAGNQAPTPSGQTGQTGAGQFHEGQVADTPNGPMIWRGGKWVPHG